MLPLVLVLHLKRFLYDVAADGVVKISKPVQFAPELEILPGTILPFVFPGPAGLSIPRGSVCPELMAPVLRKPAEPVHYKLYGVLNHQVESAGSGHYLVDLLHPNGDGGSGEACLYTMKP